MLKLGSINILDIWCLPETKIKGGNWKMSNFISELCICFPDDLDEFYHNPYQSSASYRFLDIAIFRWPLVYKIQWKYVHFLLFLCSIIWIFLHIIQSFSFKGWFLEFLFFWIDEELTEISKVEDKDQFIKKKKFYLVYFFSLVYFSHHPPPPNHHQ